MKNNILYIVFYILILSIYRLVPHPPNFTPIIAIAIVGPLMFRNKRLGLIIPILTMFLSDIIIGFHPYQFTVYLTILSIGLCAPMNKNYYLFGGMAILSSFWFYLTTNFSVWLIWDFYPKTINGLLDCYILAIPFFANTLISTLLFTLILTALIKYLRPLNEKVNNRINIIFNK